MKTRDLVMTGMMLALALVFQIGFRQFAQPLVGPLVNMVLILTVIYVGVPSGVLVGALTPLVAMILGIMGLPVLVPVIAVGNSLLVVMFETVNKWLGKFSWHMYAAFVVAAIFKFIFLYTAVRSLVPLVMPKVPAPILAAFGVSQLYTALIGGFMAIMIYLVLPKQLRKKRRES